MKKKKLFAIAMACVMAMGIAGCSSDSSKKEEEKEEMKKEFYALNEAIVLEDQTLTVTNVERSAGGDFDKPKEGKEFVIVSVVIENTGKDTVSYNPLYFKMQNSQGQIENETFTTVNNDTALKSGDLAEGGKVEGTIPFEQPTGDSDLTLVFKPSLISSEEIKIKLQ